MYLSDWRTDFAILRNKFQAVPRLVPGVSREDQGLYCSALFLTSFVWKWENGKKREMRNEKMRYWEKRKWENEKIKNMRIWDSKRRNVKMSREDQDLYIALHSHESDRIWQWEKKKEKRRCVYIALYSAQQVLSGDEDEKMRLTLLLFFNSAALNF